MGKPRSGPIFEKYYSDKMRYKRCIWESKQSEIHSYSNELHDALFKKNNTESGNPENRNLDVKEVSHYKLMVVMIILI